MSETHPFWDNSAGEPYNFKKHLLVDPMQSIRSDIFDTKNSPPVEPSEPRFKTPEEALAFLEAEEEDSPTGREQALLDKYMKDNLHWNVPNINISKGVDDGTYFTTNTLWKENPSV